MEDANEASVLFWGLSSDLILGALQGHAYGVDKPGCAGFSSEPLKSKTAIAFKTKCWLSEIGPITLTATGMNFRALENELEHTEVIFFFLSFFTVFYPQVPI